MKINHNHHTHIYLCKHALGTPEDYIKRAITLGYETIAITDHGPLTEELKKQFSSRRMSFEQYEELYKPLLEKAKHEYTTINVLSGVEIEYYDEMLEVYPYYLKDMDFLILGQHNIQDENGNFKDIYGNAKDQDIIEYKRRVLKGLDTGYFKILAHPDIFMFSYKKWNELTEKISKEIIEKAYEKNCILEINANGIRRGITFKNEIGEEVYLYPRIEFWRLVAEFQKEHDLKVMVNDDCHQPLFLCDESTKEAYKFAEKLKIKLVDHF